MNKLLLIALAGLALFASWPAHTDPLPGAYVGIWCFVNDNHTINQVHRENLFRHLQHKGDPHVEDQSKWL